MNLIIFLSSYFTIILSLIGYSLAFKSFFKKKTDLEFEFCLLGAIFFWIVISLFTHFFISHNLIHNGVILILGIISFIIMFNKNKKLIINYYTFILIIFVILIFGLLAAKTHDDFPYYHFPYTYYLTQENLIIGMGNLNHGFRTPSSLFYLNSLFYLPYIKYFSFNIGATLFFGISNLILIFKLIKDLKNKNYDFIFFLTLLSFLFINTFFYRISEHGTDRSAQILILILFIEIFSLLRKKIIYQNFFSKIFILLGLIISLKAVYVLYLLTLIPIFFILKNENIINLFKSFCKNFYFYLFVFVGSFLIIINIFNTGCILYPVEFTCFQNFDWSLKSEAKLMNNWYEQWSKAGAGPNYRVENPEEYIQGFNWVGNWIDKYFFNKVSDFLAGIIFLLAVVYSFFYNQNKKKIKIDKKILGILAIISILFIEWFYNHPSLRYGGYSLIALIFFIPFSINISSFSPKKNLKNIIIILTTFALIIFIGRNINRINSEINRFEYNFFNNPNYVIKEDYFRINNFMKEIKQQYQNCKNKNDINCGIYKGIKLEKKNNYFFLSGKK